MNNNITKNFILKTSFIFLTSIYLLKFESEKFTVYDDCYFPKITNIELVSYSQPGRSSELTKYLNSVKPIKVFYRFLSGCGERRVKISG